DLSNTNIMKSAANMKDLTVPMLLPGITVTTGPDDFYPIEAMQLVKFNGKNFERFGEIINVGKK
ncbi:MAG: branched-chain amino acid ABC transporter substrate-binding protein, partial [Alphaproteobacteria bacterium]|nr:branched-chain amino acid ABC transporter substrate-binding protein [Alphaproteobacteria bacterium]